MRGLTLLVVALAGLLAACGWVAAGSNAPSTAVPVTATIEPITPTPHIFMPVPDEMRADVAAREALAHDLGIGMGQISTRKIVPVEWLDSCLELTVSGQACQLGAVPGFRVVLDVGEAAYEVRTDQLAQTVIVAYRVDATLGELPAVCQGIGLVPFYSPEYGFCFAYPAGFTLEDSSPTRSDIVGPLPDQDPEALRVWLRLEIRPLAAGESLAGIVDAYLAQFDGQPVPEITRTPMSLGGQPAERLEVVQGGEGSRDVFMLHEGILLHFLFMPPAQAFPPIAADVDNLFLTVTASFTFLPEAAD